MTRISSTLAGSVGRCYIPGFMRRPLFGLYSKVYNVNQEEMVEPLENYNSFVEFFTRQVKPRTIDQSPNVLVSPADSRVLTFGEVKGNDVLLIKDINYGLGEFLTGRRYQQFTSEELEKIKKSDQSKEKTKLYSAIFYLNPGDYHRYHSPCDFKVLSRRHIVGYLYPVKISYIEKTPRVYEDNERVALFGEWNKGLMTQVYVGATNVGSMTLTHEPKLTTNVMSTVNQMKVNSLTYDKPVDIKKGQEVGMFRLGSTVVMIFEAPESFQWNIKENQTIKYGDVIGKY
jgi:phosphatidylserine decarboxylase